MIIDIRELPVFAGCVSYKQKQMIIFNVLLKKLQVSFLPVITASNRKRVCFLLIIIYIWFP